MGNLQPEKLSVILTCLVTGMVALGGIVRGLRTMFRLGRKANRFFDLMLGEPARDGRPAIPSMTDRMESLEQKVTSHLESHGQHTNNTRPANNNRRAQGRTTP